MDKPRKVYWTKRNGINALVLWRVAVPAYMAEILIVITSVSVIAGVVVGTTLHIWWMMLPGIIVFIGLLLWIVWMVLHSIIKDFVTVNRKDL